MYKGVRMQKFKSLLEKSWFSIGISFLLTLLIYTLIVALNKPTFANWLNGITDVAIGFSIANITLNAINTAKKGKKYFTWQYGLFLFICFVDLFCFFNASRIEYIGLMLINLVCFIVDALCAVFVYKVIYYPSTKTFAELQEDAFEKMKEKLPKIGREKFLDWEKSFRVCKTSDGTLNGDLDFNSLFSTVEIDGKQIPMTFKSAQARGYMDVAQSIHEVLVAELDKAGIK